MLKRIVLLSAFFTSPVFGQNLCVVRDGVFHVTASTRVHLAFGIHGTPSFRDRIAPSLRGLRQDLPIPPAATLKAVREALAEYAGEIFEGESALARARRDKDALDKIVADNPGIQWLGVEQPRGTKLNGYYGVLRDFNGELRRSGLSADEAEMTLHLGFFPGPAAFLKREGAAVPIAGVDDPETIDAMTPYAREASGLMTALAEDTRAGRYPQPLRERIAALSEEASRASGDGVAEEAYARVDEHISASVADGEVRARLLRMNQIERIVKAGSLKRDVLIAAEVLRKTGVGLLVIGASHKRGLERELTEQCRRLVP